MKQLTLRIRNILLRPAEEWKVIQREQASTGSLLKGYGAIMAAVPPSAALADRVLLGNKIAGRQPLAVVLSTNLVWFLVIMLNMIITAVVFTTVIRRRERRWIDLQALQLALYSFTPLFLVSVLTILPGLYWLTYAAIAYSFYVLYVGIRQMTGEGQRAAAWHAFAACFVAGVIVGSLNAVEYLAESYIATRVFY